MKKQYSFAHLFVRAAKALALLVILIGVGFCVLRYYQASIAAGAVAYRPSSHLQQALDRLKAAFLATEQIIDSFNAGNQSKTPNFQAPRFPLVIDSENDFARISAELSRVDHERQQLKESIVSRFENLVESIEEKLHVAAKRRAQRINRRNTSVCDPARDARSILVRAISRCCGSGGLNRRSGSCG